MLPPAATRKPPRAAIDRAGFVSDRTGIPRRDRGTDVVGIGSVADLRQGSQRDQAFKTTEFYVFLAAVIGVLIAGNAIEIAEGGTDYFTADKVWLYVTILTVGYMISRGLAKSGSRDPYWGRPDEHSERNGRESR